MLQDQARDHGSELQDQGQEQDFKVRDQDRAQDSTNNVQLN